MFRVPETRLKNERKAVTITNRCSRNASTLQFADSRCQNLEAFCIYVTKIPAPGDIRKEDSRLTRGCVPE